MDLDNAETVALVALAFLADDAERLGRFLALTGLGPAELRTDARTPRIMTAILEHLRQDESLLLAFAANNSIQPETIIAAYDVLARQAAEEGHA